MTEQPEPTRPIDMSKILDDDAVEDPTPPEADAVAGEPGWTADAGDDAPEGQAQ